MIFRDTRCKNDILTYPPWKRRVANPAGDWRDLERHLGTFCSLTLRIQGELGPLYFFPTLPGISSGMLDMIIFWSMATNIHTGRGWGIPGRRWWQDWNWKMINPIDIPMVCINNCTEVKAVGFGWVWHLTGISRWKQGSARMEDTVKPAAVPGKKKQDPPMNPDADT